MDNMEIWMTATVIGMFLSFFAGAQARGLGIREMLRELNSNNQLKDATEERLTNSLSPKHAERVFDIAQLVLQGGRFIEGEMTIPGPIGAVVKDVAGGVADGAQFVSDVTDSLPNVTQASFSASKGIPQKPA